MASHIQLFINGDSTDSVSGATLPVVNPATGEPIGTVSHAERPDLDLGDADTRLLSRHVGTGRAPK
jgi:acyl-CoA reductase-like NAD-dependent aldehyde dehydrogenase